jgi:hypothetical protein
MTQQRSPEPPRQNMAVPHLDESVVLSYLKQWQSEPTSQILRSRRRQGHSWEEIEAMRQILVERQKEEQDLDLSDLDLTPPTGTTRADTFCTGCGQQIAAAASFCTLCGKPKGANAGQRMDTSLSGRASVRGHPRAARVLLAFAGLWIIVKAVEVASSGGGFALARALDFTNPSLFGIVGFASLIAYFFVRPKTVPPIYAPASKNTCDQCGSSFLSNLFLEKSQDGRHLCEKCRARLVV